MLTLFFGVLIGLALGLTGGGGSIFAIPLLIFGLGLSPQEAMTISFATVATVALTGAIPAAKQQLIEWRAGIIFAIAGLIAAPFGVMIANGIEAAVLLMGFALLMLIVALSMWKKASSAPDSTKVVRASVGLEDAGGSAICRLNPAGNALRLTAPCSLVLMFTGILTGLLSGIFGVGGGFVIVPALMFVTQLSIQRAVATSLFVITIIGTSGLASALLSGRSLDIAITGLFMAGGVIGMMAGRTIAGRITGPRLQKLFALAMVATAIFTLVSRWPH